MRNNRDNEHSNPGGLRRLTSALSRAARRLTGRGAEETVDDTPQPARASAASSTSRPQQQARTTRRESDIPLDVLDRAYTPPATSAKASFRSDGSDHQSDQEFALGFSDERWNDEDHLTNKSGDPRIGTHGRAYEPGENRSESRNR